ncbi:hypothetical protein KP509_36G061000 [Ceratopteris richardii]|uniref:GATA-type domain-containing protein n=1 Tax=Ceratopteris richardii TaxID=49495 RepID=A0A8T2QDM2_CERRI|nr:hypothetical protein KP509_36G061000 [Ceratopteris richardii]
MEVLHPYDEDVLSVEELLDFSCGDIGGPCDEGDGCVASAREQHDDDDNDCHQPFAANFSTLPTPSSSATTAPESSGSFYSPPEELAGELQWLSTFVENSYNGVDQSMPLANNEQWFTESSIMKASCRDVSAWDRPTTTSWLRISHSGHEILDVGSSPLIEVSPSETLFKGCGWDKRGRSKRSSRSGGRVWSLQTVIAPPLSQQRGRKHIEEEDDDFEDEEEEHSQSSSVEYESFHSYEAEQPHRKKAKKERPGGGASEEGRRCSHCQVQKTPQWRAGPLGPKTLCNACGVRYKSGRLLPEYRPAASPTFVSELHSNSHKKVLEMRNSKSSSRPTFLAPTPPEVPPPPTSSSACGQQHQEREELSCCTEESMDSLHLQQTESRP